MFDFQKQVIEKSHQTPVLVDFWAPWCGPCRVLGPVLERLAEEQKDRWELVKINTEEEQQLAMQHGIRSIPNVKLFHHGKVVGEFAGAKPKHQIEQWLDEHIPEPFFNELQAILDEPDETTKTERLRHFVAEYPDNKEAKLALAQQLVFQQPEEAQELVAAIQIDDLEFDSAEDIRILAYLMQLKKENGSAASSHLDAARQALATSDFETAIQRIIDATMADKSYANDLPRLSAIALFRLWGREHPLTQAYRRRFDMVLY